MSTVDIAGAILLGETASGVAAEALLSSKKSQFGSTFRNNKIFIPDMRTAIWDQTPKSTLLVILPQQLLIAEG